MKRLCLLATLLAAVSGNLCAVNTLNLTCSLSVVGVSGPSSGLGAVGSNGCFSSSFSNITGLESLNWGDPSVPVGESGLGIASPGNNFVLTIQDPVQTRTATQGNDPISIQLAPSYGGTSPYVTLVEDYSLEYSYSTHQYRIAGADGTVNANPATAVAEFNGHFNSLSAATPAPGAQPGDTLLALPNGGPLELSFVGEPAFGVWFEIASMSGTNSLFEVYLQAFGNGGVSLGSYTLTESGSYGSGGTCTTLTSRPPVPCNDAPYVGFYDPEGRIRSIYISVCATGSVCIPGQAGYSPLGFAIDSLYADEVPEPAIPLLIGGGLAAMALYRRKRLSRSG